MSGDVVGDFRREGYVVLRRFFDRQPLRSEVQGALAEGLGLHGVQTFSAGGGTVSLQYLPMMCERTPVSLGLAHRLAETASVLLGRAVLPGRSKGTRYHGDTSWHRDSEHDVASLGCVAYLDTLTPATGALRILPGSHAAPGAALTRWRPIGLGRCRDRGRRRDRLR